MDCYIKKNPLIEKKDKKSTFKICKECFNYYHRQWTRPESTEFQEFLDEIIDIKLDSFLKIQPNAEINYQYDISMDLLWSNRKFILEIEGNKYFPEFGAELSSHLDLEIKIEFTYCDSCLQLRRGAYTAIMNISREEPFKDSEVDDLLQLVKNEVNVLIKKDRMAFLAKYQIGKNRVKLFLGSEKLAKSLAQTLLNKWGGISNEYTTYNPKSKLKGKKHDKLIINLKLPSFFKGDIISIKNQPFMVKSIRNDIINLTNLSSKRNEQISLKDDIAHQIIRKRENLTKYQVVSIYDDIIQIMDEKTYELYEILKNDELLDINIQSKLLGLKYNNRVFIIPKNDENV